MNVISTDPLWSVGSRLDTDSPAEDGSGCDSEPHAERAAIDIPAPAAGFTRLRMTIAYDGSKFRGMAENEGVITVAGIIRAELERCVEHPIVLSVAGRTDAGVHAWGQVISFDVDTDLVGSGKGSPARLARAINQQSVPAIVVRDAELAAADFDARFSAVTRSYRYTIVNRPVPDPFLAATSWWVPQDLDLHSLQLGCDALYGLHNFSSFCRRPKPNPVTGFEPSLMRRVHDASWHEVGDGILRFDITASSYCHQMVRSIVGTLIEMGRGTRRPGEMAGIIRAQDRSVAGGVAPPQGLCLWEVGY
jgi:tRNA pseudouridine38-40 synthase